MQRGRIVYEGDVGTLDMPRVADYLGVGRLLGRGVVVAQAARTEEVGDAVR